MKKFNSFTGIVCPLDRDNVDTDAILPKQFLKSVKRSGFGNFLFDDWRFLDRGSIHDPKDKVRLENPDFVLNQPRYRNSTILLSRSNFGCGSSREHAPWALEDYGFRVIIASSFGDIFFENCFKNSILPVVLGEYQVDELFKNCLSVNAFSLRVDLESQIIYDSHFSKYYEIDVDEHHKYCLINGLDEIDLTLKKVEDIRNFEERYRSRNSWLF